MFGLKVSIIAILVVSVISSVTIRTAATSHQISETELSSYLSTMVGLNHQSVQMTPELRKITNLLRLSLLNPIEKITVLLVIDNNIAQISQAKIELTNQLGSILSKVNNKIAFSVINGSDQASVQRQIEKYTTQRSVVVIIRDNQSEIQKLSALLKVKGSSSRRRLSQKLNQEQVLQQTTDDDVEFYLIKFFFSLLFIIIIIGIVGSIARNDGKKDTLLYAKFIADVSNNR